MQNRHIVFPRARQLAFFLIIVTVLAPLRFDHFAIQEMRTDSAGPLFISQDTTWHKNDNLFFARGVIVTDGATLTIEAGATVRFSQGGDIFIPVLRVLDGRIVAQGTQAEKITFMPDTVDDQFGIAVENYQDIAPSIFRHVVISGGGYVAGFVDGVRQSLWNTALAYGESPAFAYNGGKVHMENVEFVDSKTSAVSAYSYIGADNPNDFLEIVNSNFTGSGQGIAVDADISCDDSIADCYRRVWLKNNWYGDARGPSGSVPSDATDGEIVSGTVFLDHWRKNSMIVDPVVIIPGIMGSAQVLGEWRLDPILHTYDDLVGALERNGYEENVNLFTFPYEWRNTNVTSALYLQSRIEGIIQGTKVSKVDVVAHSMGGLVVRAYIEEIEGTQYADTIDQLITLGTPHNGSPEAYLKWEAGEGFFTWKDVLAKHHFEQEAEEAGYNDNLQGYIQDKVVSVRELLPDYSYIFDTGSDTMRDYPIGYPRNTFLEDLNIAANRAKLADIDFMNIVGRTDQEKTISRIRAQSSTVSGKWEHGMPENFYDTNTDQGLEYGSGDETVPQSSAEDSAADTGVMLNVTHNDLPTAAQCEVFRRLTGMQTCSYEDHWDIPNLLLFKVFSPIDIQIVSPSGKKMGKNFETGGIYDEILGAYYTGYDTANEFVTIPNPEDGEYRILTQGTGEGGYRIEVVNITEGATPGDEVTESVATFSGTAMTGVTEEKKIEISGDEVRTVEENDSIPPTISIASPENKSYLNDQMLPVTYAVTDNVSAEENIQKTITLDGDVFPQTTIDLSLQTLGNHTFSLQATDEAGNVVDQSVSFENTVTFDSLRNNLDHYFSLGLIKKKEEVKHIREFLRYFEMVQGFLERLRQMPYFPSNAKERIIRHWQKELDHMQQEFIEYLSKKVRRGAITPEAKDRIVEVVEMLVQ